MKRSCSLLLAVLLLLAACLGGCGEKGTVSKSSGGSKTELSLPVNEEIKGTVKYAVRDKHSDEAEAVLKSFQKMYPNITVETEIIADNLQDVLTTRAAANNLPDVVYGWDNLSFYALQGWLYPLDEFMSKDSEIQYLRDGLVEGYKYNGKTYALPAWLQFSTMVVNLDLCEELNLDVPSYDWTIDEFVDLAKKATNEKYSGLNHVESLDQYIMETSQKEGAQWGYDPASMTFNLTNGAFEKGVNVTKELMAYPGLVADALRNSEIKEAGGQDDYAKKFGSGADGLADGKVLIANQSTWDNIWLKDLSFNWDFYPIPQDPDVGYKEIVHSDYGIMLSTAKDPEAAYELLKFLTYGKDGLMVRMEYRKDYFANASTEMLPEPYFIIPASNHPDVVAAFDSYDYVPKGLKYMYKNLDKSIKGDYSKVLPDYWTVVNDNIYSAKESIDAGQTAAAVAKSTETKINSEFKKANDTFIEKMKKIQSEFDAKHQ